MFAQNVQLVRQLGGGEEVARVRVLGDQAQRFLFAHAPDQDARAWPAHGLGHIERAFKLVMLPGEGFLATPLALPHLQADPQGFFQALEAFGDRRERNAEPAALRLVPGRADTEPRAAAREDVQGRHGFR